MNPNFSNRIGISSKQTFIPIMFIVLCTVIHTAQITAAPAIEDQIQIDRGICMILDDNECETALRLARATDLKIYVQLSSETDLENSRIAADKAGYYGKRIYVDSGPLNNLHLADNLADVLIAPASSKVDRTEILRVLRPGGRALVGDKTLTAPVPEGLDDWSHPYHGPDNNPQSEDRIVKGPYLTQFLVDPRYGPLPQVAVASAGRVFKAFGHVAFKVREEPMLNKIVAFNGYNGTILWQRDLSEKYMIHRNTFIATPETVYIGDDKSCKLIDAVTGELRDEIIPDPAKTGGTFWKWMALQDGILYAMVGRAEQADEVQRQKNEYHGWPWNPISPGFNQPNFPWGFGKTIMAIDPKTKNILWMHKEQEDFDSRAVCMNKDKLFIFSFGKYLTCLDPKTGEINWRITPDNSKAFASLGGYLNRQDWRTNWKTTVYLKCSDDALYFSGPPVSKLLALSAKDGSILWEHPYNNYQLIIRDDALYAISGQIDEGNVSRKFNPLTGEVLAEIEVGRRACTRPTAATDSIFFRANGGSTRLDVTCDMATLSFPMRAQCQDGVTVSNGGLYWWPSTCDCNLSLYGVTSLAPAGDFDFVPEVKPKQRLTKTYKTSIDDLGQSEKDWPTFRANNVCDATTSVPVPGNAKLKWKYNFRADVTPTAATAAGGLVFLAGDDGIVRAVNAESGKPAWNTFTGGAIRIPPTIAKNRAYVGSGDGYVYCLEAATGAKLWKFRTAPAERRIVVYGQILSTWPAASGVLVDNGTAYVASGIVSYDGTYVYALDAESGEVKWHNSTSGHLDPGSKNGVSVQGHMLLMGDRIALAGGIVVSPAIYSIKDGTCYNDPELVRRRVNNNVPASTSPRGWELFKIANGVVPAGRPYYAHPDYVVYDDQVFNKTLVATTGDKDITWVNGAFVNCYPHQEDQNVYLKNWGKQSIEGLKSLWQQRIPASNSVAIAPNAVIVGTDKKILALDIDAGKTLWSKDISAPTVPWGLTVTRTGAVIAVLKDGNILCFTQ